MADGRRLASEATRFDREFLRSALALAARADVDHFLYICDTPIAPEDLRGQQGRKKLIYAVTAEAIAAGARTRRSTARWSSPPTTTRAPSG